MVNRSPDCLLTLLFIVIIMLLKGPLGPSSCISYPLSRNPHPPNFFCVDKITCFLGTLPLERSSFLTHHVILTLF